MKAKFTLPKSNIKSHFNMPKNGIKTIFKIQKVVPLDNVTTKDEFEALESEVQRNTNQIEVAFETITDNKEATDTAIGNLAEDVDTLFQKATTIEDNVENLIYDNEQNKTDISTINTQLSGIHQNIDDLEIDKADKENTYTKSEIDAKLSHIEIDAYTKTETNALLNQKQPLGDYATNTTVTENYNELTRDIDDLGLLVETNATNITNLNEEIEQTKNNLDALTGDVENLSGEIDNKQPLIDDLEQIRANAEAGANITSQVGTNTTNISNLQLLKQNITDDSLTTSNKTITGAVNELLALIRDIQLFKFPDATIIGNPTINNGQISDFSSANYLILPSAFDTKDRAFEINMAFRTGTNITTTQNLLGGNLCIALLIESGKLVFRASNNGTGWNVADITTTLSMEANTNYYVRIEFNKLNYKILYSTNGEDYNQVGYKVTTEAPRHGQVLIGIGNNQHNPFLGIINLNKTYIKLNNSVVWQGMDDAGLSTRLDLSLSNIDEIGQAKFDAKQDNIEDLDTIINNASNGATAYTTIQGYGDIVTHNAIEFALKSEIPDVSKYALDSSVVHKANAENISGVKTFTGGTGGNNVAIKAPNGIAIGGTTQTAYSQYATIRNVNGKVATGSYYIDGNSSVLFRHKTGTATAEGTANDAMFTINPETGIKAGWSGTAGKGITDADLHDVFIDTIEYSKLNTTAKDIIGAINELNNKINGILNNR